GAKERRVEEVGRPVRVRPTAEEGESLALVGVVEPLERRNTSAGHRALKRTPGSRCEVMQLAVVGHVEWVEFARVDHMPEPGEIVHALETWEEPAGGGAVAAVQLAHLPGSGPLF